MLHLHSCIIHAASSHHAAVACARYGPLAGRVGERFPCAVIANRHHVEAAGVMIGGVGLPEEWQAVVRQQFGGALYHTEHVVVGHVEHFAHLQSGWGEWYAIRGEAVRVGIHVVHRADQASVRRECGRAVDQVEPVGVAVFFEHARAARAFTFGIFGDGDGEGFDLIAFIVGESVFRISHGGNRFAHVDGEHLIVLLASVLHKDDRLMPARPADCGQVFVGFMVPLHLIGDCPVAAVVAVEAEFQQGQSHVGISGQCLRIAVGSCRIRRVSRVRKMPDWFRGFVVGFEQHIFGIGRPPEAVVAVHFLACCEFRQADLPFAVLRD